MGLIVKLFDKDGNLTGVMQIRDDQNISFKKGSTEDGRLAVMNIAYGQAEPETIPLHGGVAIHTSCGTHLETISHKTLKG